jgi:tetratricopeptide (TPR) repeat protein
MVSLDAKKKTLPNTVAHRKYTLLAEAMQLSGFSYDEVMAVINKALKRFPRHPEVLACRGDEFLRSKYLDDAIAAYESALSAAKSYSNIMSNNFTQRIEQVSLTIADLCAFCGRPVEALDHYFELLKVKKYNQAATLGLLCIIRPQEPEDAVALLDSLYSRESREDVAYLLGCFLIIRIPKLLIYYEKIWRTKFGMRDVTMIASLLCAGNFEAAVKIAVEPLAAHPGGRIAAMACAGIILGETYADYEMILKSKDAESAAALEVFRKMVSGCLFAVENCKPELFAAVLSETVQSISDEQAFFYIEKAALIDEKCFDIVKNELESIRRYALLERLHETRAMKNALQKGRDMFFAGVYAMMRNDFARANEHFTSAMHNGFYSDEMQQYIRICKGE